MLRCSLGQIWCERSGCDEPVYALGLCFEHHRELAARAAPGLLGKLYDEAFGMALKSYAADLEDW